MQQGINLLPHACCDVAPLKRPEKTLDVHRRELRKIDATQLREDMLTDDPAVEIICRRPNGRSGIIFEPSIQKRTQPEVRGIGKHPIEESDLGLSELLRNLCAGIAVKVPSTLAAVGISTNCESPDPTITSLVDRALSPTPSTCH
jgi:hypothetical protein